MDTMPERDLVVRRVQADDAKRVADFVNSWVVSRAPHARAHVKPCTVIARLGEAGFLIAEESDEVLGLIGWHVENLVACVTDLLVRSAREQVGRTLLNEMEAQATGLQAEVALLLLPRSRGARPSRSTDVRSEARSGAESRPEVRSEARSGAECRRVAELMSFCEAFGYTLRTVGELPRAWRETAHRAGYEDDDEILLKQLRSDRVVRPL
jgi:hypothetical protein